eukprot:EG_transcript_11082
MLPWRLLLAVTLGFAVTQRDDVRLLQLDAWLTTSGILLHPAAELYNFGPDEGVGLRAQRAIAAHSTLVAVPLPVCLGPHSLAGRLPALDPWLAALYDCRGVEPSDCEDRQTAALALFLLATGPKLTLEGSTAVRRQWGPYLQHLAEADCHNGLLMSQAEVAALYGTARSFQQTQLATYRDWYRRLLTPRGPASLRRLLGAPSERAFLRAVCRVQARSFGVPAAKLQRSPLAEFLRTVAAASGEALAVLLVPGADLLNHRQPARDRSATDLHVDEHRVRLRSLHAAAAGAEVYNTYGRRGNAHLLVQYGFVQGDNPEHAVLLPLQRLADPWGELKDRVLQSMGLIMPLVMGMSVFLDGPAEDALAVLRILLLRPADVSAYHFALALRGRPVTPANERLLRWNLRRLCAHALAEVEERAAKLQLDGRVARMLHTTLALEGRILELCVDRYRRG